MPIKVKDIAKFVNGELVGDGEVLISGINGINEAGAGEIVFVISPQGTELIKSTKASCVVVPKGLTGNFNKPLIKVDNPSIAFSRIINLIMPGRIPHPKGVHHTAVISKTFPFSFHT